MGSSAFFYYFYTLHLHSGRSLFLCMARPGILIYFLHSQLRQHLTSKNLPDPTQLPKFLPWCGSAAGTLVGDGPVCSWARPCGQDPIVTVGILQI